MFLFQPPYELVVGLETFIVFDLRVQTINLMDMPRRVFVARGTSFTQREFNEGAPEQNRGQWVFAFDGPRGWIKSS
jgi:hypothetical protein